EWIPVTAGQDTALWMAINHVILKEYHVDREVPYFNDYVKRYTDSPFLVELEEIDGGYAAGRMLRANRMGRYQNVENGDWKFLVQDDATGEPRSPKGSVGHRWSEEVGKWNLKMEDGLDDQPITPVLSFFEQHDEVVQVSYNDYESKSTKLRGVPMRYVETADGRVPVATVFDLMMAQFGVGRGLEGDYPTSYDDDNGYTPAWQENLTGIGRDTVIRMAREFAGNAEATNGKSMIIV
ncbi:MAG TPA: nitrate reductase subunit alpha, partial [Dehalococcoidia bacterium]|nr:nitrate reductase subunit alpha [Dehalococcoidia bacterium]